MGKEFTNLSCEDLCDLMCGGPESEGYCMADHDDPCEGDCDNCPYYDDGK